MTAETAQFPVLPGFFAFPRRKRKTLKNRKNGENWQKRLIFHCGEKTFVISLSMA